MTDKERIERILKIINLEYPDRIKLGKRMNEVYKILAMDELELLTLDQYRGQNMDFVLEKLQKEGLALGDTMRQLDRQIAERFNVRVVDLQSDLALLNQFDVENMRDLPKQITQGMSIEPRNKPPEADYYNKLFEEIAEQNPLNVDKDLEEGFKIQDNLETSAADEIDGVGLTDEDLNLSTENDNFLLDETDPKNKEKFNEIISNIDEPLDQNVIDFREKQLEKLMKEVEDATPDVTKISSSQAEMIDNALADAAANLRRGTFEALPGGKGALTKAIKTRLVSILGDGLNVLDVYELGLLLSAVGQPALDPIVKLIFPDAPDDNRPYKERVLENIQRVEKISLTAKAVKKISEAMPEPVDREYTIYGAPSNRKVQFTSMYGMLGGNNGEK